METTVHGWICRFSQALIIISNQPVSPLTPWCCVLSGEAINMFYSLRYDPTGTRPHNLPHSVFSAFLSYVNKQFYKTYVDRLMKLIQMHS